GCFFFGGGVLCVCVCWDGACAFSGGFVGDESRKKTTRLKYDPPYVKKPVAKYVGGATQANHHSQDDISLAGSNKMMFGNQTTQFRDHKSIRRMTGSVSEDDPTH
uniref:Uncharacterized protein n=1 Tax=Anopheles albimanus TaxID=7167 RepID=A0A182FYB1_ANOAL